MQVDNADIPVMILCGGMGTRLREASEKLPKPLVDIGGKPILWHIMKLYGAHGFRRFVLCLGYKSPLIKRYFLDYSSEVSDFTLHMGEGNRQEFHGSLEVEDWEITFAETGLLSATGARVARAAQYLGDAPTFMLTYGDGIGDVDLNVLLERHPRGGRRGTSRRAPGSRYGEMKVTRLSFVRSSTRSRRWPRLGERGFFAFERASSTTT
jgi:glucose-1-phosphate cytidylyltransferase